MGAFPINSQLGIGGNKMAAVHVLCTSCDLCLQNVINRISTS